MNGVEILSRTEVATEFTSNWWLAGSIFLAAVVICGVIVGVISRTFIGSLLGLIPGVLIGLFLWAFIGGATETPTAYETHYKVIISDSVSMNEFTDRYEIIDQDGKIYTVRERE